MGPTLYILRLYLYSVYIIYSLGANKDILSTKPKVPSSHLQMFILTTFSWIMFVRADSRKSLLYVLQLKTKMSDSYWTSPGNRSLFQSVFFCLVPTKRDTGHNVVEYSVQIYIHYIYKIMWTPLQISRFGYFSHTRY
jgi:hypothetical protein